ncbi:hypothetical protein JZ751_022223 [Albula glossodonta]|uniref:Leiomodin-3 n=1 Tax=Albula glossodonta TaxID=121402 RepID=A0A8T2NKY5_9TELE|nr:hypothetical protein JZ751_022223 [Albula glossodonta]
MTAFGYHKELGKYEDLDEDELLASLTSEELRELERELEDIDPDCDIPIGLRQRDQTAKTPKGTFSREALLNYWESETHKCIGKQEEEEEKEAKECTYEQQGKAEDGKSEGGCVKETNSEQEDDEGEEESEREAEEAVIHVTDEDFQSKGETLKSPCPKNKQDLYNRPSKNKGQDLAKTNGADSAQGDCDLKETPIMPCRNPTMTEETLEKVLSNDADTHEVNLNNTENVSQDMLVHFAEALRSNTHVWTFSLANTRADDRVALAVAEMLKKNNCLRNLNVESNFITGKGILALIEALQQNRTLTELRFHNQRHICGAQAEMEMVKLLRANCTLLKLGYQFHLPGPRMSVTSILTRNQDQHRQRRQQEQEQKKEKEKQQEKDQEKEQEQGLGIQTGGPQRTIAASTSCRKPHSFPRSSPKLLRKNEVKSSSSLATLAPPSSPPPQLLQPPRDKVTPTRRIADTIKLHEENRKQQTSQRKAQSRKWQKVQPKGDSDNILKELKNALRPKSRKSMVDIFPSATPQRCIRDDLMAAIRGSSRRTLRQVSMYVPVMFAISLKGFCPVKKQNPGKMFPWSQTLVMYTLEKSNGTLFFECSGTLFRLIIVQRRGNTNYSGMAAELIMLLLWKNNVIGG